MTSWSTKYAYQPRLDPLQTCFQPMVFVYPFDILSGIFLCDELPYSKLFVTLSCVFYLVRRVCESREGRIRRRNNARNVRKVRQQRHQLSTIGTRCNRNPHSAPTHTPSPCVVHAGRLHHSDEAGHKGDHHRTSRRT